MLAADKWIEAFKGDPEYDFLISGVTDGFDFPFSPPESVDYFEVENYVPDVHIQKVTETVRREIDLGRQVVVPNDYVIAS
eukprot:CAMPEP_0196599696 /NCGR_PEP_ID=MMETSP1081-20130531/94993_1 /TAXON_ID=36882 /ORGANISM="Pyramimonas amylifera, Strain CCMP720" /LENGTH=79 /DNA_ID=CAMNT_0041925481 /DNA_START=214 /DNA_END=453 /DNA_ORIENTATION=+